MFSSQRVWLSLLLVGLASVPKMAWSDDIRQVNATVDDLLFNPVDGKLYGAGTTGATANSIIPIDTATATVGTAVSLGAVPKKMVISSDGHYIDSVIGDGHQIRRFDTTTQSATIQWDLGHDYSDLYARDIVALPGSPGSVIVSRQNAGISPALEKIVIYDNGVLRNMPPAGGVNTIEVNETGTRLYGYLADISSFDFGRWDITPAGLTNHTTIHQLIGNADFIYGAGRAYGRAISNTGVIFDPETGVKLGEFTSGGLDLTVPDASTGRLFTALQNGSNLTIQAQNLTTLAPLGSIVIPNVNGTAGHLLRWGANGLAFRAGNQVFLVRSALVFAVPPTLTSVTPDAAMWGTPVVISGQDFTTTSSVKFNGVAATFRVDSDTQITANVPGGATTGPLTVTTQGGTASTPFTVLPYVPPTISVEDASVVEGNSGSKVLSCALRLSAPAGLPVSVNVAATDGTAVAGQDYTSPPTTVTIRVGQSAGFINVPILGDTTKEPNETFTLSLSNPTNATLGDAQGLVTIKNDDYPTLSMTSNGVIEGNSGTTPLNFTLNLSYASDEPVSLNFTTADGTAVAGSDYVATKGTLTFAPGETSKTISVAVKGDTQFEPNETVILRLSKLLGAVADTASGTEMAGTILNDDPRPPSLSVDDIVVTEGDSGIQNATFTVSLTSASTETVEASYTTADGTAKATYDYSSISGTLTFAPGETSKTFTVEVLGDTVDEPNEQFQVNLTSGTNTPLLKASGTCTIADDDLPPDTSTPYVGITSPTSGQNLPINAFNGNALKGFSYDNVGVVKVQIKLSRTRGGVEQIWDGTNFTSTPARVDAQISSTSGTTVFWVLGTSAPPLSKLDLGSYTAVAYSFDAAGNMASSTLGTTFTLTTPDTEKPSLTLTTPTQQQKILISNFSYYSVLGTTTDNIGVSTVRVKLERKRNNVTQYWNGTDFTPTLATVNISLSNPPSPSRNWVLGSLTPPANKLDSGPYRVTVMALDASGNASPNVMCDFTLGTDFTTPDVTISTPSANQNININSFGAGSIQGSASDNLGVAAVKVRLQRKRGTVYEYWNGSAFTTTPATVDATLSTVEGKNVTWSFASQLPTPSSLDVGAYTIYAYAYDAAGNSKNSASRTFNITGAANPTSDSPIGAAAVSTNNS